MRVSSFMSYDDGVKLQIRMDMSPVIPRKVSILWTIRKAKRISYIFSRTPQKSARF